MQTVLGNVKNDVGYGVLTTSFYQLTVAHRSFADSSDWDEKTQPSWEMAPSWHYLRLRLFHGCLIINTCELNGVWHQRPVGIIVSLEQVQEEGRCQVIDQVVCTIHVPDLV